MKLRVVPLACLLALAACAAQPRVDPVVSGGSRADGVVTMGAVTTIWNPVAPDWREGQVGASRRCHAWGYEDAGSFTGWQEACRSYDRYGRCTRTLVTRFYRCTDA